MGQIKLLSQVGNGWEENTAIATFLTLLSIDVDIFNIFFPKPLF